MISNAAVAIARHLTAVERRDLAAFSETIHPDAIAVLPTGARLEGADKIIEFHRGWFTDKDWTQQLKLLRMSGDDVALSALYEVEYHDVDEQGGEINKRYLLGLVFVKGKDGQWLMFHDQCTPLPD